jgi:hypothetical protein
VAVRRGSARIPDQASSPAEGRSVVTIPAGDLDARGAGHEPGVQITTSREMDSQLPRRVTVQHLDYDREYNAGTQYAERLNTAAINATDS